MSLGYRKDQERVLSDTKVNSMSKDIACNDNELKHIYSDTCVIIEEARERAYRAVNVALTLHNWMIGERITREHLGEDGRAE